MTPKVTIVVGVYNGEKYLGELLESIRTQTSDAWRCVCVNDGSTDGSADILADCAAHDRRFRVITRQNGGVGAARNSALAEVSTPYVMFADQDDWLKPNAVARAVEAIETSGADIVRFNSNRMVGKSPFVWERIFRYDRIRGIRFPPITGGEDTAFLWELSLSKLSETQIPDVLYVNRAHGGSFSRGVKPKYIANVFTGIEAMWNAGLRHGLDRRQLRRRLFPHVFWFSASIVIRHPSPKNIAELVRQLTRHLKLVRA